MGNFASTRLGLGSTDSQMQTRTQFGHGPRPDPPQTLTGRLPQAYGATQLGLPDPILVSVQPDEVGIEVFSRETSQRPITGCKRPRACRRISVDASSAANIFGGMRIAAKFSERMGQNSSQTPRGRQGSNGEDGFGISQNFEHYEDLDFTGPASNPVVNRSHQRVMEFAGASDSRRQRSISVTQAPRDIIPSKKLPVVFKWALPAKTVFLSGSWDNWKLKYPMVKSEDHFYTIVELPIGTHQYKFSVDGTWTCDLKERKVTNELGSENNELLVRASDFEVFEALDMDSKATGIKSGQSQGATDGEFGQVIPPRSTGFGFHLGPPILPPHLLQVILNKEVSAHCEPTLLPEPNHVMLNHLYALSIKDGVMVLSTTHRYRKKYITTLLYKPIDQPQQQPA